MKLYDWAFNMHPKPWHVWNPQTGFAGGLAMALPTLPLAFVETPTLKITVGCPTERYEQITITEHKIAEVTLTNGVVLRQELTNRVVSDRIRTWKLIQTEEFVDEKDVPQLVFTNSVNLRFITVTNVALWQIDNGSSNITIEEKP